MHHVISADQFSPEQLSKLFEQADYWQWSVKMRSTARIATGKVLANLFYEPSTRTSASFISAMVRLGGSVIPIDNVKFSSVAKGESLADTIRTMQCYTDVIVLRHPETGASQQAVAVAKVPIINAGDGEGEHPTQALLDLYTIKAELKELSNLHVVMMGDLLRGRTVKSLSKLLRKFNARITWVSPMALRVPKDYVAVGEIETDDIRLVIPTADVLYLTRAQNERTPLAEHHTYGYGITAEDMRHAPAHMVLMHPLPRLQELPIELDSDPRSAYFRQVQHGLFMRMAVLADVMNI